MKCLDQQGLKYLWSLIKDNFATSAEVSNNEAVLSGLAAQLSGHTGNTGNPHNVTKAQIGLGNVDNTADANKPISTAQQTALNAKANYEEGTWTPKLALRESGTLYTPITGAGSYKIIGNHIVHLRAYLYFEDSLTSQNTFYLRNLPTAINPINFAGTMLGNILVGGAIVNSEKSILLTSGVECLSIQLPSATPAAEVIVDCIYFM